jgi:signal peptidase I
VVKLRNSLAEKSKKQSKTNRILSGAIFVVTLILALLIVMNTFVFMTIEIDGSSMYPTLYNGDVIKVNKLIEPERGDIVIIKKHSQDKGNILVVKRVIAIGGDTIRIEDGVVYLNGEVLIEEYIKDEPETENIDESRTPDWSEEDFLEIILNKDEIFYLGDNRCNSVDSRQDGCCKESDVVGVLEDWSYKMRKFFNFFH